MTVITCCQKLCLRLNEKGKYNVVFRQNWLSGIYVALKKLKGSKEERVVVIMNGCKEMLIDYLL